MSEGDIACLVLFRKIFFGFSKKSWLGLNFYGCASGPVRQHPCRSTARSASGPYWAAVDIVLKALSDDPNDVSVEPGKKYYFLVAASEKSSLKAFHPFHDKLKVSF